MVFINLKKNIFFYFLHLHSEKSAYHIGLAFKQHYYVYRVSFVILKRATGLNFPKDALVKFEWHNLKENWTCKGFKMKTPSPTIEKIWSEKLTRATRYYLLKMITFWKVFVFHDFYISQNKLTNCIKTSHTRYHTIT